MNKLIIFLIFWFLTLNFASCKNDIIQVPANIDKITNSSWQFIAFDSSGIVKKIDSLDAIFISLKENNRIEGTSRGLCVNYYSGVYYTNGNKIAIDSLISTEALCPLSRYWEYYNSLKYVNYFHVSDSQLFLYYNKETQRLLFKKLINR